MNKLLTSAALLGVIAASATVVSAADAPAKVKCYGISAAGKNDCKTANNSCAGKATKDNDPSDWKYATAEECAAAKGSEKAPEAAPAAAPAKTN